MNGSGRSIARRPDFSNAFWLQLGEITFQGREAFDDRSIALEVGGISVMHRFGQNPGVVMKRGALLGGQQVLAVVPQEAEDFRLVRFRALIAQRSCEV